MGPGMPIGEIIQLSLSFYHITLMKKKKPIVGLNYRERLNSSLNKKTKKISIHS